MQEVRSGGSYLSQSDMRLHFGLEDAKDCTLEIRWPSGLVEEIRSPRLNSIVTVVEGKGTGT
jgi:hypothetical protein